MRPLTICALSAVFAIAAGSFACSGTEPTGPQFFSGGGSTSTAGSGDASTAGTGTTPNGGTGAAATTGGQPPATGGSDSSAGTGGGGVVEGGSTSGGTGGSSTGETGGTGTTGGAPTGGTGGGAPVIGRFKMLVYEETRGYAHPSISAGNDMIKAMGMQNDFEVVISDGDQPGGIQNDPQITAADLAPFDMVFFMNPTGAIFGAANSPERDVFKTWLKEKKSFAGVHATTDTEYDFAWYQDLVGEIYSGHTNENLPSASVNIDEAMKNHPTMVGLPSPWTRNEEWYRFTKGRVTGTLPGFQVLLRFGGPTPSQGPAVGQPIAWIRCWEGVRSFYTAMGHDKSAYADATFKKHVLQGVMWAARRTHAANETCP